MEDKDNGLEDLADEEDSSLTKEEQNEEHTKSDITPAIAHNKPESDISSKTYTMESTKEQNYNEKQEEKPENPSNSMSLSEWLSMMKWRANPFIFTINPSLRVGYRQQTDRILMALEERHKFLLILGPTGSGKTTLLKWLEMRLFRKKDIIFIGKPPSHQDDFTKIIRQKYPRPLYAFWQNGPQTVYQIPDFLNARLKKKHLVVMLDEAQEAGVEVLEWLRVLSDQIDNMSVVLSGLPNFEDNLKNNLETFAKRISAKAELLSLTKEETGELISKRIRSVGGRGNEFDHVADQIYNYTGGFPREVIRICDEIVNNSIMSGTARIEFVAGNRPKSAARATQPSIPIIEKMTPMQKEIMEMLSKKPLTPGQIANSLELEKYKSRQHAVRSLNNVMKAMYEEGYLERRREDKAYVYSLSPRISTLFVKR